MLDPKLLRTELPDVAAKLEIKGFVLDQAKFSELENDRKTWQIEAEKLQNERNVRSKAIGQAKAKGEDVASLMSRFLRARMKRIIKRCSLGGSQNSLISKLRIMWILERRIRYLILKQALNCRDLVSL